MNPPNLQFDADTLARFNQAKQAGVPDEINYQKAAQYQASKSQSAQQPQQGSDLKSMLIGALPTLGAIGGSFIPGAGTIVGGAAGAGLGALLKQLLTANKWDINAINPQEIGKEALLGGAGGVLGEGLGFLGGKLIPKLGTGIADIGEQTGIKALRLNPSQIEKFSGRYGEDVAKFLTREGAIGKDAAQITADHLEPLQQQFNAIAKQSGLTVNPQTFQNNLLDRIQKISNAGGTENAKIAENLLNEGNYVLQNSLNPAGHDISAYDSLRRTFANKVNWANPTKAAEDYAMADVLRKSVIDTADQAGLQGPTGLGLKDIGLKLSKFRDVEKMVTRQEALGRGSLPGGITKLLPIIAGIGLGGPAGGAAGYATSAVINSPDFLRLVSNALISGGGKLTTPEAIAAGQGAGKIAGQLIPRAGEAMGAGGTPEEGTILPQDQSNAPATLASNLGGVSSSSTPQQDALRKVLATYMFSKAKNVSDIKTAFDFLNPSSTQKPLAAEQQRLKGNAESGLAALDMIKSILARDPNAPIKSQIPVLSQISPYAAASREVADVLTRIRTGAALNKEEQAFYQSQLPQPFDSAETIQYKLKLFEDLFSKFAYGQVSALPDSTSGNSINSLFNTFSQ